MESQSNCQDKPSYYLASSSLEGVESWSERRDPQRFYLEKMIRGISTYIWIWVKDKLEVLEEYVYNEEDDCEDDENGL